MKNTFCSLLLLLSAGACFTPVALAQTIKPGLWEVQTKVEGAEMSEAMAQMREGMASMSAEERKIMEDMMAKKGMSLTSKAGGGIVAKTCLSKEMVARNQMPIQQQGDCTTTVTEKNSSGMKMRFVCAQPPSTGDGQITYKGDLAYTMKMVIKSTNQGRTETSTVVADGKWISGDCGGLKPMQPLAK